MIETATRKVWATLAQKPVEEIREATLTGYQSGKTPWVGHNFRLVPVGTKFPAILDFGCGLGRNAEVLLQYATEDLVLYDLPQMLKRTEVPQSRSVGIAKEDNWNDLTEYNFDLTAAVLTLQHIEQQELLLALSSLSTFSTHLYVAGRNYCDGYSTRTLFSLLEKSGCWRLLAATESEETLRSRRELHFEAIFETTNPQQLSRATVRLQAELAKPEQLIRYQETDVRLPITMTQLFTANYEEFAWHVLHHNRRYAQRHGYDLQYRWQGYDRHADRHPSWHRIPYLLELMTDKAEQEWFFWTDIDSVIMRPEVRLESILANHRDKELVLVNQGHGDVLGKPRTDCICFGQFFIRNTPRMRQFLQDVWHFPERNGTPQYHTQPSWEQEAVNALYYSQRELQRVTSVLPNRWFNSFEFQYQPGDFILHFAGVRDPAQINKKVRAALRQHGFKLIDELPHRRVLNTLLPQHSVGAELGVMQGIHALQMYEDVKPSKFYLIDFWSQHHNSDWLRYKSEVAAIFRDKQAVQIMDLDIREALQQIPDDSLDWVYIDSWHDYRHVWRDMSLTLSKLKSGGLLCGHDFQVNPDDWHTGPPRAVIEIANTEGLEFVALTDEYLSDWVLRKP